jgi:superfamily I DNA/RNA helicase
MANEEQLYAILEHLPEEAAERLFRLASGAPVPIPARSGASGTIASRSDASRSEEAPRSGSGAGRGIQEAMSGMGAGPDPFAHEDAKRRFRVMDSQDELRLALEAPWERWVVFLHPSQRKVIERTYNGPARVAGAAGTGKTVVALHRAAFLARSSSQTRVLLTTFSKTLATRLGQNADLLLGRETPVRQRVEIVHLHKLARDRWVEETGEPLNVISPSQLKELIGRANRAVGTGELDVDFLRAEWNAVVDPWGIDSRNRYKVARRAGRGTRLNARQRLDVWKIFAEVQEWLRDRDLMTWDQLVNGVARRLEGRKRKPFTHVIVDEAQDFGPAELRLLRALVPQGKNDLFFCADAGQRIYRATFTWKSTGVDIRGRSSRLTVNYRTTEQIRGFSDRLSPPGVVSATGENEPRDSVSLLRGPVPEVLASRTPEAEVKKLARVFKGLKRAGYAPRDIGVFARRTELLKERAIPAIEAAGLSHAALTDSVAPSARSVSVGTMHRAKGLEFKVVFVVGCDRAVLPLRSSLDRLCDASDRQGFVDRERNLLYVACTRARERLYVSHTGAPTVFLAELEER